MRSQFVTSFFMVHRTSFEVNGYKESIEEEWVAISGKSGAS